MARTTSHDTVVLVDDELHNVSWIVEFLNKRKLKVITAENLNQALNIIEKEIYRALVVDLNIPAMEPVVSKLLELGGQYPSYPGLYLAYYARNLGYRGPQVVLYTVHRDASVLAETKKLGITYIIKGRPQEIKRELDWIVSFDPTKS